MTCGAPYTPDLRTYFAHCSRCGKPNPNAGNAEHFWMAAVAVGWCWNSEDNRLEQAPVEDSARYYCRQCWARMTTNDGENQ